MTFHDHQKFVSVLGWFIYAAAILPLPILAIRAVLAQPSDLSLWNRTKRAARPLSSWGPENLALKKKYDDFIDDAQRDDGAKSSSIFPRILFRREKSYSVNL